MSFWTLATKADIGICGYANSLPNLFKELSLGMMSLLIPHDAQKILPGSREKRQNGGLNWILTTSTMNHWP